MGAYEIVNPPAFGKKSQRGKFIYVLMFNVPGHSPRPFYVGQTSGLTARFGSHAMVMWHLAKFDSPVRIWIAGEVPRMNADAAEQDLITRLTSVGYLLTNKSITMSYTKRTQRQGDMTAMTAEAVREYLATPAPRTTVIAEWANKWRYTASAQAVEGSRLTAGQIRAYVASLKYPTEEARNLSLAIAEHHNPGTGHSTVILEDAMRGVPGARKVHKHANSISGIWYFARGIRPEKPHDFRLTKRHLAVIARQAGAPATTTP